MDERLDDPVVSKLRSRSPPSVAPLLRRAIGQAPRANRCCVSIADLQREDDDSATRTIRFTRLEVQSFLFEYRQAVDGQARHQGHGLPDVFAEGLGLAARGSHRLSSRRTCRVETALGIGAISRRRASGPIDQREIHSWIQLGRDEMCSYPRRCQERARQFDCCGYWMGGGHKQVGRHTAARRAGSAASAAIGLDRATVGGWKLG